MEKIISLPPSAKKEQAMMPPANRQFVAIFDELNKQALVCSKNAVAFSLWDKSLAEYAPFFKVLDTASVRGVVKDFTGDLFKNYIGNWPCDSHMILAPFRDVWTDEVVGAELLLLQGMQLGMRKIALPFSRKKQTVWSLLPIKSGQTVAVSEDITTALAYHQLTSIRHRYDVINVAACRSLPLARMACEVLMKRGCRVVYVPNTLDLANMAGLELLFDLKRIGVVVVSMIGFGEQEAASFNHVYRKKPSNYYDALIINRAKRERVLAAMQASFDLIDYRDMNDDELNDGRGIMNIEMEE